MIRWRPYHPTDHAALRALHDTQCARSGVRFAFPDLSDPRYLVIEVAERDGQIAGAVCAHATVEVMFLGATPLVARAAIRERARLAATLRAAGADEAHAFVPNCLLDGMKPLLQRLGLRRSNPQYTPFYTEL